MQERIRHKNDVLKKMGDLANELPIQHWIPIVSQEFKVRIEITFLYDKVLLIHVVPPLPHPTSFANYHFNPHPLNINPWAFFRPKNYSDLMVILLFLAFLLNIFMLGGVVFLQFCLRLTSWITQVKISN